MQVVNLRNDGAIPGLPDDAVVEIPAAIDRDGAHPLPVAPLEPGHARPRGARQGLRDPRREAAVTGDRRIALRALMANPLVGDFDVARPLLDALLDANRGYLPRFFAGDAAAPDAG